MNTGTEHVRYERRGAVAWVTFDRPEARNAMTWAMYDALVRVCDAVETDPEVRVLVLTGAGEKAFVAGTDIGQFRAFANAEDALAYEARVDHVITRIESLAQPTIAAVRGYAVGGGATIALACDLRICTPDARFGVPIARTLGNCLSMANYARLVDLIGPARTKELIFTARLVPATDAAAIGFVNAVVAAEELESHVQALAEEIASRAPITIQVTKEAVRRVLAHRHPPPADDLILRAYLSEDFREGVEAFLAKRPPRWKGK